MNGREPKTKKTKKKAPEQDRKDPGVKTEGQKKREAFNNLKMDKASLRKSQKKNTQNRNNARKFKQN